jgi:hypothetical protein
VRWRRASCRSRPARSSSDMVDEVMTKSGFAGGRLQT